MTNITSSKRLKILLRDKFKCQICGVSVDENAHLDHLIQKARNGSNSSDNLATTCKTCNLKRGNRLSHDYLKIGYQKHNDFLKLLIDYEKKFGIFDEVQFQKGLALYAAEINREIKNFNKIINMAEENTHESRF